MDQEIFVWTQSNNNLINPLASAAIEKIIVAGKSRFEAVSMWKSSIKIDAAGFSNILSGAVKIARNGNTAPILNASLNEAIIIKKLTKTKLFFLFLFKQPQTSEVSVGIDFIVQKVLLLLNIPILRIYKHFITFH